MFALVMDTVVRHLHIAEAFCLTIGLTSDEFCLAKLEPYGLKGRQNQFRSSVLV